jgi:hyperosmotically inducible protein
MNISRNLTVTATLACMLALPVGVQAASEVGANISKAMSTVEKETVDTAITAEIKTLLALESDIKSFNIEVTTKNHIVSLKGNVDTGLQADKAIETALSVNGVTDVVNLLTIKNSDNYTGDAFVTAKVKGTIMQLSKNNKINGGSDLHIETTNGAVHIFGTVTNIDDVAKIKAAATAISGVKSVNTNIDVKK